MRTGRGNCVNLDYPIVHLRLVIMWKANMLLTIKGFIPRGLDYFLLYQARRGSMSARITIETGLSCQRRSSIVFCSHVLISSVGYNEPFLVVLLACRPIYHMASFLDQVDDIWASFLWLKPFQHHSPKRPTSWVHDKDNVLRCRSWRPIISRLNVIAE